MSAKILVIGDPHIKDGKLNTTETLISSCIRTARTREVDAIVVLGDILDTHERCKMQPFNKACDMLERLSEVAPVYLLIGNHDRATNQVYLGHEHFFRGYLKGWPRIHIVDSVQVHQIADKKFVFIPYVPNGRLYEAIDTLNDSEWYRDTIACFGHIEVDGIEYNGRPCGAEEWKDEWPMLFDGHIHDYSRLKSNVVVVGTSYQVSHGESENKGVMVIEAADKDHIITKRVAISIQKKKTITVNVDDIDTIEIPDKTDVRIHVIGTLEELKAAKPRLDELGVPYFFKTKQSIRPKEKIQIRSFNEILIELLKDKTGALDALQELLD